MKEYKFLTEMGVVNPEEIAYYSIYVSKNIDILRITYNRKKGSLLPVSKVFKFPQLKKQVIVDGGTRKTQILYESMPILQNALIELNEVIRKKKYKQNTTQILIDEITNLEADIAARINYIKSVIKDNH